MRVSRRALSIQPSPTLSVGTEVKRLRAQGADVIDLGVGEPDFPTVPSAKAAAHAAIDADLSHYTPTVGTPELRAAVALYHARVHGTSVRPEDVVIGGGAKPLLFQLLQAAVDPGDDVVVSVPAWVSFPAQVALAGGRLVAAHAAAEDGFVPRAEQVRRVMTARTSAVVVNSPCNPTGAVMPEDEVEALVRLCAEAGALLIFDEMYDFMVFEGRHASPLRWRDLHPDGIACVGAASKTFAMTGWRIGWAVAPGEPAKVLARMQDHVTSNANTLAQAAALAALTRGLPEAEANVAELRARRDLVVAALDGRPGITCPSPAGTFFAFPAVDLGTGSAVDSTRLAVHLLRHAGVAVMPGAAFGREGHVRVSFAASRDDIARGLSRLVDEVARLRRDPSRDLAT
jgi:aspartate aminotransferase